MKKIIFTLALFMGFVNVCLAQNHLVATLQHEGEYTHFYGVNALNDAYNSSEDGDIITLSAGNFVCSEEKFDKGITLRGVGIDNQERTIITNSQYRLRQIFCSDPDRVISIEGIQFVGTTYLMNEIINEYSEHGLIKFNKCRFDDIRSQIKESAFLRVQFSGCVITGGIDFTNYGTWYQLKNLSISFNNCYVNQVNLNTSNTMVFDHCVVDITSSDTGNAIFSNSIIYCNDGTQLPEATSASYCLGIVDLEGEEYNLFDYIPNTETNTSIYDTNGLFKTFKPSEGYTLGETFELTEKAQQTYIGGDDSQVGMHGGLAAYSLNLQYPIVTKLKANSHTTKEGMLAIDVEVDGK